MLKRNDHYGSDSIELDPFQIARIRILDPSQSLFQFEDPERYSLKKACFQLTTDLSWHEIPICITVSISLYGSVPLLVLPMNP